MSKDFTDDIFLSKWLSGDLSDEEVKTFEQSDDFLIYKKIADTSALLEAAPFNKKEAFDTFLKKQNKNKPVRRISKWTFRLVASVVILFGIYFIYPSQTKYVCENGEQFSFYLPDSSTVILNAQSQINYKESNWFEKRELSLNGEAFFDVTKGAKFVVHTQQGDVTVLGTEFNVQSRQDYFEIQCFEGSVSVHRKAKDYLLKVGDVIRFIDNEIDSLKSKSVKPTWIKGESRFENLPVGQVLKALERYYDVRFVIKNVDLKQRFTGSFCHNNLKLALKSVCYPLGIKFKIKPKKQVVLYCK